MGRGKGDDEINMCWLGGGPSSWDVRASAVTVISGRGRRPFLVSTASQRSRSLVLTAGRTARARPPRHLAPFVCGCKTAFTTSLRLRRTSASIFLLDVGSNHRLLSTGGYLLTQSTVRALIID